MGLDPAFSKERDKLFAAMDQPTIDAVNTYFVSKSAAEQGLKVALSGVGGDELFGGYPSFYQVPRLASWLRPVPKSLGRAIRALLSPIIHRTNSPKYAGVFEYGGSVVGAYLLRRALFMPWEIPAIVGEDTAREGLAALNVTGYLDEIVQGIEEPHNQVMALEYSVYMRNCLLRDADWAGMAHGLEIRMPLVDHVLFRDVVALSKEGRSLTKQDFARAPRHTLSEAHFKRPKTGFNVPTKVLMHDFKSNGNGHGLRAWALQILSMLVENGSVMPD